MTSFYSWEEAVRSQKCGQLSTVWQVKQQLARGDVADNGSEFGKFTET